jgi:hypothetical protein
MDMAKNPPPGAFGLVVEAVLAEVVVFVLTFGAKGLPLGKVLSEGIWVQTLVGQGLPKQRRQLNSG